MKPEPMHAVEIPEVAGSNRPLIFALKSNVVRKNQVNRGGVDAATIRAGSFG